MEWFSVHELQTNITIATIVTGGLVTGILFAFANFVMRALAELSAENGMFAMQQINLKILNPLFTVLFFGSFLLSLVTVWLSLIGEGGARANNLILGACSYLLGPIGITVLRNVPLNNRLAAAEISQAAEIWPDYQLKWQRWNRIRTFLGIISMLFLCFGLSL